MNRIFIARLVEATANKWFDILTRASILEGAAGVPLMSWVGGSAGSTAGISRVMDRAEQAIPGLDPKWTVMSDTGMFNQMIRAARSAGLDADTAEELVNGIVGGASRKESHLWQTGKNFAKEIAAGADPKIVSSWLVQHARTRALDIKKKKVEKSVSLSQETDEGGGVQQRDIPVTNERDMMDAFTDLLQDPLTKGPIYAAIRDFFKAKLGDPDHLRIFEKWLENPEKSATQIGLESGMLSIYKGKGQSTSLAAEGIRTEQDLRAWMRENPGSIISATRVSKVLRQIWSLFRDFIESHQALFRDMYLREELHGLSKIASRRQNALLRLRLPQV